MLRKTIVAIAAIAALGTVALSSNNASARGWGGGHVGFRGGGWRGGGWRGSGLGWRGGPRFYGYGGPYYAYGYTCWRWVPSVWGPRRVWVC